MSRKRGVRVSLFILIIAALFFLFAACTKKPAETVNIGKDQEKAAQKQTSADQANVKAANAEEANQALSSGERRSGTSMTLGENEKGAAGKRKGIKKDRALRTKYVVKKGDSLWWIAKYRDVYNDPFLWPVIFDANKKEIKNPNRIYPGQVLQIPRSGYKTAAIHDARKKAGARAPYNPPARAVPPVD